MRIVRDPAFIAPADRGAAAAIGNFDGVHLGHRAVIDTARGAAEAEGVPLGVMTFEPHPREVFAPHSPAFRLMNAEARANRLEKIGVEVLYEVPFTHWLAGLSPDAFAREVIVERLGLAHVIVGRDFVFGKGRSGDAGTLQTLGQELGFGVTVAPLLELGERRISSTAIREALSEGRPREAAEMLGHWHRIDGEVIRGDQRGRDLGYPTVNMSLEGLHPPRFGVYAVKVEVRTGPHAGSYEGAASVGVRPTFGGEVPNCETYIFDFAGDLYGAHLSVALVDYLRPEEKFDSLEALIEQMNDDCARARERLADA